MRIDSDELDPEALMAGVKNLVVVDDENEDMVRVIIWAIRARLGLGHPPLSHAQKLLIRHY